MAITRTQLTQSSSTANSAAYDTATVTPAANGLVLVLVRTHYTTSGSPTITVTSNAGLSLTFSSIKQVDFNTIAAPTDTVEIFGALAGSTPGSGSIHIAISKTCSGLIWEVIQLQGVNTTGGTVASCIQQTGSGSSDTAGTTWTDTFGSAVNTNNAVIAAGGNANKNAPGGTWNNGFTQDVNVGSGESTAYNLGDGHVLSGFTGTSHTVTSTTASAVWGIIGAEVKATTGTLFTQSLSGSLSFSGALTKRDNKKVTGTLSFTGPLTKRDNKSLSGALSFTGVIHKKTLIPLSGGLSFTGILSKTKVALKNLSGSLSFTGVLTTAHRFAKALSGALSFIGVTTPVKTGPAPGGDTSSITHVTKPTRLVDIQRVKDVH